MLTPCPSASGRPIAMSSSIRSTCTTSICIRGIGRLLLPALIDACAASGYRQMIGYIDACNQASIQLHESLRFPPGGLSAVDRLQIWPMDGFDDDAALARAGRHGAAGRALNLSLCIYDSRIRRSIAGADRSLDRRGQARRRPVAGEQKIAPLRLRARTARLLAGRRGEGRAFLLDDPPSRQFRPEAGDGGDLGPNAPREIFRRLAPSACPRR